MQYLNTYLQKIRNKGNAALADSILETANEIGDKHLRQFSFVSHEIGLLFGNVQSGKTGQMFGVMCKAADLGFPAFILLTTDNVALQQQTLNRVKKDLEGFCVCGENDGQTFMDNSLLMPAIVVLKKNVRVLKLWANILASTGFMKGNPLFIVDDEADAASLNTLVNRDRRSSINKYLDAIRKDTSSSIYLQVTGTPQALFLQTMESGWHPFFTYYFKPGAAYLGGDFFFPKSKPKCIVFNDELENPTRSVVIHHIAASAQIMSVGGTVCNCLVHPSVRQNVHQRFADEVKKELNWCAENVDDRFEQLIAAEYESLTPEREKQINLENFLKTAKSLVEPGAIKIIIMNGKNDVDAVEYETASNFIIGGNTLGRGITFPGLQTIYYTRSSKKPQADTMWQHSRMFGYDRDPGLMKVFIDEKLYKLFSDINATNNSVISQVESGVENIKVFYPEGISPTRRNVLDNNHLELISGGTNYYPNNPDNNTIEDITTLLMPFNNDEAYYQVSLRLMKEVLGHIVPSIDFKLKAFMSVINTILADKPTAQGILIVRRNRDIAQGTGALLSPNDWKLGGEFTNEVVLTMYQVTGSKGWGGKQLWIPNIKLPSGIVYYDVIENTDN